MLARDHYVGPAPVPFLHYEESVRAQVSQADVTAAWLQRALQHLTLTPDLLVQLGPPVNARAPLFLYGAPGNGRTTPRTLRMTSTDRSAASRAAL